MLVPLTSEAMEKIYSNNSELGVRLQIVNAMFVQSLKGGASWANGNATRWTLASMDGGDYDPPVGKPVREADNITLTLEDNGFNLSDIVGDFNGDKIINSKDLTRLMKFLAGEDVQINGGDVTDDGKVNSKDLTRLMKYLAGEDVVLKEQGRDVPNPEET